MKHLFIVNPAAGKGHSIKYLKEIENLFNHRKEEYVLEITKGVGDAINLVRDYVKKEDYRVYSIGGDGTLNEVINGIIPSKSSLGVIPAGTGNDFIKSLYNSKDYRNILLNNVEGKEKLIDLAKVNNRYFINISSVGFDAEVTKEARSLKKKRFIPSSLAYVISIFKTIFKFKGMNIQITIDEKTIERKALLVAVANGKYYGGGMKVTPEADIEDGLFDICIVKDLSKFKILTLFPKLIKGTHDSIKEVEFFRGNKIEINSDKNIPINVDGEIFENDNIVFELMPKSIKIINPNKEN